MAEEGVPMSKIAQYLGHSNDKVTQKVYARYSPEFMKDAAAALEL
jgi:integrase